MSSDVIVENWQGKARQGKVVGKPASRIAQPSKRGGIHLRGGKKHNFLLMGYTYHLIYLVLAKRCFYEFIGAIQWVQHVALLFFSPGAPKIL